ncbi:M13-type metalloendopeptidase [Chryseolinea sp. T2]|uniref:M13-type metalloendopeptidase n=1 Tax=Chryseolinea sp. T2 TaxID=3129255 RepID=UPI003077FB63
MGSSKGPPGFDDKDLDDAVIYGYGAASTIGHELTHAFDDQGSQYDEKGNLRNWWTKEDKLQFDQKVKGIVKHFNNYVVLDSLKVNGEATAGENIADLGGIVIALDAFKKTSQYKEGKVINGLSPVQRFFMGYAYGWKTITTDELMLWTIQSDVHSPAFLRINGPFSLVPEFYEAFNVKPGQPMWRPDSLRVKIW